MPETEWQKKKDGNMCKDCAYYYGEDFTETGVGIGYCDVKESRRYRMDDGSIPTVVYEDGSCKHYRRAEDDYTHS